MKRLIVTAAIALTALVGGGWYLLTSKDREASAAIKEALETANKISNELTGARNELELARVQAEEAAKVGDLAKQRENLEKMRSLELKVMEVEKRIRSSALAPCKTSKSSVEAKAPDGDKAEKVADRRLQVAQSKACGPGG